MTQAKAREVDMDELRRGVEKVVAFGNPSVPQSKTAEKKARHRSTTGRRTVKARAR